MPGMWKATWSSTLSSFYQCEDLDLVATKYATNWLLATGT